MEKELAVIRREIVDADDFEKVAGDLVPNRARLVRCREYVAQAIFEQETGWNEKNEKKQRCKKSNGKPTVSFRI